MPKLTPDQLTHYHESRQPAIIGTSVVFLFMCNFSVIIRIVSQLRVSRRLFLDDYAIIFAAICSDVTGALYLNATQHGLGLHIYRSLLEDPSPPQHLISLFRVIPSHSILAFANLTIRNIRLYTSMRFSQVRLS